MKKSYIILIVVLFLIFIWYLINSEDISKMNEIHKISQQKEHGLFSLNNKQQEKLDNYIKEIAEIKVRGCSTGANIFFIKCGFIDNVGRYALGNRIYQQVLNEVWNQTHKLPDIKPFNVREKDILKDIDYNYKGLFSE